MIVRRTLRWLRIAAALPLLAGGVALLPHAFEAARLVTGINDPAALVRYRLASLTGADYAAGAEAALSEGDAQLAASIAGLAAERGVTLDPGLLDRIAAAQRLRPLVVAGDVVSGFVTGRAETAAGFGAALVSDLTVAGDIRDLVRQAALYPAHDPLVVALAATGAVLTGVTLATSGAALPAKTGVSTLKVAARSGKLSKPLMNDLARLTARAVDMDAVKVAARGAARLERAEAATAARRIVRADVVEKLTKSGDAVARAASAGGYRAALQTLNAAESAKDLEKLGTVAQTYGRGYRGALALTARSGKAVLRVGDALLSALGFLALALGWALSVLWLSLKASVRTGLFLGRLLRPARAAAPPALEAS